MFLVTGKVASLVDDGDLIPVEDTVGDTVGSAGTVAVSNA